MPETPQPEAQREIIEQEIAAKRAAAAEKKQRLDAMEAQVKDALERLQAMEAKKQAPPPPELEVAPPDAATKPTESIASEPTPSDSEPTKPGGETESEKETEEEKTTTTTTKPKEKKKTKSEKEVERLSKLSDDEIAKELLSRLEQDDRKLDVDYIYQKLKWISDRWGMPVVSKLIAGSVTSATVNRLVKVYLVGGLSSSALAGGIAGVAAGATVGAGAGFLTGYRRKFRQEMNVNKLYADDLDDAKILELGILIKRNEIYADNDSQKAKIETIKSKYIKIKTRNATELIIRENKALLEADKDDPAKRKQTIANILIKTQEYKSQTIDDERDLIKASSGLREKAKELAVKSGKKSAKYGAVAGAGIGGTLGLLSGLLTAQPQTEAATTQPAQPTPETGHAPPAGGEQATPTPPTGPGTTPGAPETHKGFLDKIFEHKVSGDHLGLGERAINPAEALINAKGVTYSGDIALGDIMEALKTKAQLPEEMHKFLVQKGVDLAGELKNGDTLAEFARKMLSVEGVDSSTMQDALYHLMSSGTRIPEDELGQLIGDNAKNMIGHLAHTDYTGIKDAADESFRKAAAETFAKWLTPPHTHNFSGQEIADLNKYLSLSGDAAIQVPGITPPAPDYWQAPPDQNGPLVAEAGLSTDRPSPDFDAPPTPEINTEAAAAKAEKLSRLLDAGAGGLEAIVAMWLNKIFKEKWQPPKPEKEGKEKIVKDDLDQLDELIKKTRLEKNSEELIKRLVEIYERVRNKTPYYVEKRHERYIVTRLAPLQGDVKAKLIEKQKISLEWFKVDSKSKKIVAIKQITSENFHPVKYRQNLWTEEEVIDLLNVEQIEEEEHEPAT